MKILSLASGGIDSTLMIHMLMEEKHEVNPLFINYGQLSFKKEYESYVKICDFFKLKPEIINLSEYGKIIQSGITSKNLNIYDDAFLPNRNLLFLLIGSSYAFNNDIYVVSIGLIKNPIFPDQTKTFLGKAERQSVTLTNVPVLIALSKKGFEDETDITLGINGVFDAFDISFRKNQNKIILKQVSKINRLLFP